MMEEGSARLTNICFRFERQRRKMGRGQKYSLPINHGLQRAYNFAFIKQVKTKMRATEGRRRTEEIVEHKAP